MMKLYPSTFIYSSVIISSLLIISSSNNWFFMWMGLELSLFGFLPLFTTTASTTEAITKYFLMQASGSAMFIMSFLMTTPNSSIMMLFGMLMKLGLFPFFQWMPLIMVSLTWSACLILTTVQKIGPLLIMMMTKQLNLTMISTTLSIFISSFMGFNQTLMRKLMAYSSISHTSWILLVLMFNQKLALMYMLFYFMTTIMLFNSFKKSKTDLINQSLNNKTELMNQNISMLVLTGIPPFSIFFMKLYIFMLFFNFPLVISILIMSTYISTYYYLSFILPNLSYMTLKSNTNTFIMLSTNLTAMFMMM